MLKRLLISNYALIENLDIDFEEGLNIITGETGSGKSIILGALGLILGDRAEKTVVHSNKKKCIVEGVFQLSEEKFKAFFEENDLDFDPESHIRREVVSSGKSRAFVNDTPVNLNVLKELGMKVVDIHSQHQTLRINKPDYQLDIFDKYLGLEEVLQEYSDLYQEYIELKLKLESLKQRKRDQLNENDFLRFQLEEFRLVGLEELDPNTIEEEYHTLANAEEIQTALNAASNVLSEDEAAAIQSLKQVTGHLAELIDFGAGYKELFDRLNSSIIELDDISSEILRLSDRVEVDPRRLSFLEEKKASVFKLETKHGVEGIDALLEVQKIIESKLDSSEHLDLDIEACELQVKSIQERVLKKARELRSKRMKHADSFANEVEGLLRSLNMKKADFSLSFTELNEPSSKGIDALNMLFSANTGQNPMPLGKVASGGELSRLMLTLKRLSARKVGSTSLVFDEIDSGVSGEVANSMGKIMKDMSASMQLLSITHLPQIAAKGQAHFKVFKIESDNGTKTEIKRLNENDRVIEIAQMLSGERTTEAAIANARDLLHLN